MFERVSEPNFFIFGFLCLRYFLWKNTNIEIQLRWNLYENGSRIN